jgi:hypothetical protein
MIGKIVLVFGAMLFVSAAAYAETPRASRPQPAKHHARHKTLAETILGGKATSSPRPPRRTDGLPTGRSYFGNRYYGNFNNRFFGPQYGYF